ncbi:MAG TPA: DivIVA domain-containing protein [Mycobacteriales bacterium]|nr:DivIVA domain-containing protein [Mycobacteriales bacterium]
MSVPYALLGEVVLAGAVLAGLAAVIVGRAGTAPDPTVDAGDDGLPDGTITADDLPRLRFGLAARGYRMAEVDAFVDRVADQLARRDALIRHLGGDLADLDRDRDVAVAAPAPAWDPAEPAPGFGTPPPPTEA